MTTLPISVIYRKEATWLHNLGGWGCTILTTGFVAYVDWVCLFPWVAYAIYFLCKGKKRVFFAECTVFVTLILTLLNN